MAICLLFAHVIVAGPLTEVVNPTEDTFVRSGFTSQKKNFGTEKSLELQIGHTPSEAYLKFDLSNCNMLLKKAVLRVYATAEKPTPATVSVRSLGASDWSELTVNWKDKPEPDAELGKIQVNGTSAAWYELDVTQPVKTEVAAGHSTLNIALVLEESAPNKVTIESREADANKPELTFTRSLLNVKVVFRPNEKGAPTGYLADTGGAFGPHTNGFTYGWNTNITKFIFDRSGTEKIARPPDVRYSCLASMDSSEMDKPAFWGIAVPNGRYKVHLVAGDAANYDSVYALDVNKVLILEGVPDQNKRWVEGSKMIPVTNQKLIISNAPKSINNKICFIEIAEAIEATASSSTNRAQ